MKVNSSWRRISFLVVALMLCVGNFSHTYALKNQLQGKNNPGTSQTGGEKDKQFFGQQDEWVYFTQAGDTLESIASRFQVLPQDIRAPEPLTVNKLINPGMRLVVPRPRQPEDRFDWILEDYQVVFSPSAIGFDIQDYVSRAGGYLSTHQEYLRSTGLTGEAEIIERIAVENSFDPRLLLAILEYQCGCVFSPLEDGIDPDYLAGIMETSRRGLYRQLGWVVNQLSLGYYGWREGLINNLVFKDGSTFSLPPDWNAGSAAIAYLFSRLNDRSEWNQVIKPGSGFNELYQKMYADEEYKVDFSGPLFPADLTQPDLILPFQQDREWGFTSGPHPAWETDGALAALDFAPASEQFGCQQSDDWVVAVADGLIVRSEHGAVVLDLDKDGSEQTGWAVLYMHVEGRQRTPEGTYLRQGDPIGHPSCEGGPADGTHVHIARKYNGEWIAADGPLPFTMSGWTAQAGYRPFEGSLSRADQVVEANPLSPAQAFISLGAEDVMLTTKISRDLWWEEQ